MTASLLSASLLCALLCAPAHAAPVDVPRKVLALYTRAQIPGDFKDIYFLSLHQHAELPLNHLGLEVVYHEASSPLPDPAAMKEYRGIVTWFSDPVNFRDPSVVCRWMSRAMAQGLKVVVLGNPGLYIKGSGAPVLQRECRAAMSELGIELGWARNIDPIAAFIDRADPAVIGFERKPDPSETGLVPLVRFLPGAAPFLSVRLTEGDFGRIDPVGATPKGGIALDPFFLYANYGTEPQRFSWITNPFAFFEAAFAIQGLPRPDVTTLNGRRVYFSHIDGDGFFNRSELDRRKWSGEVFYREFLLRYSSSPFTASYITGYFDLSVFMDPQTLRLSTDLMNLPNVEPAAHGYAHPLVWRTGEVALRIPRYTMDARKEIPESVKTIERLFLPGNRKVPLFLWTGDCLPSASDVALSSAAALLNMNGGGGRFDAEFPSYSYLFGLARPLGAARQIYAPSFNENEFTELWSGPFYGYRKAVETFERTGSPRRIKPVNVYVHFYSAEKYAALQALTEVYRWVHAQPLIPVTASRYVTSVRDFFDMRIQRATPGRFLLEGGPQMRTLRFDAVLETPDLRASQGVIGWRRENGSLYVFLDESSRREVVLAKAPAPEPALEEANFEVFRWKRQGGGVSFFRRGWWEGSFTLQGLVPGRRYHVRSAGTLQTLPADKAGRLTAAFPDSELSGPAREVQVEPAS